MSKKPKMAEIIAAVEVVTSVGEREIKSRDTTRRAVHARWLTYFVASQCYGLSNEAIAAAFKRNLRATSRVVNRIVSVTSFDPAIVDQVEAIVDASVGRRASAAFTNATLELAR